MKKNEFEMIRDIREMFSDLPVHGIGIGDDAAFLPHGNNLITTDTMVDGVHFMLDKVDLADIGYKIMAVNLSDIAAMGGTPETSLLTLGLPHDFTDAQFHRLMTGIHDSAILYRFSLAGGDIVRSDRLFVTATMVGHPLNSPILRSGAKTGDIIYISNKVGDSAIGLMLLKDKNSVKVKTPNYFLSRHLCPSPRIKLVEYLTRHYAINSCIDISDGVIGDLQHIVEASGTGYFLELNEIPVSDEEIGKEFEKDPYFFYELAATGGEDYELLFTSADTIEPSIVYEHVGVTVKPVGRILESGERIGYFEKELTPADFKPCFRHFEGE
ncbi:MAG: thiamine-phosphate kinase [Spirochaetes bacterium GWF1_49_6]|nr:MAG: thiamine-phosphate kinase [Spirochaetes bacterium GWF1_49_6]